MFRPALTHAGFKLARCPSWGSRLAKDMVSCDELLVLQAGDGITRTRTWASESGDLDIFPRVGWQCFLVGPGTAKIHSVGEDARCRSVIG